MDNEKNVFYLWTTAVLVLLLVATLVQNFTSPAVCSYEVSGNADLTRLKFPSSILNGSIGKAGFTVKGQTFCRDVSFIAGEWARS